MQLSIYALIVFLAVTLEMYICGAWVTYSFIGQLNRRELPKAWKMRRAILWPVYALIVMLENL